MRLSFLTTQLLLVATQSAALQEVARPPEQNPTLPQDGRVAVLLRGQSHRCRANANDLNGPVRRIPCCKAAVPVQKEATASLVKHVIQPLEALGNKVDIVATDGECNLTADNIISQLGGRVLRSEQRDMEDQYPQNANVRFVLETFKAAVPGGSEEIAASYDLVLLLRQDITWKQPIASWQDANFSKLNFASRCEKLQSAESCVSDVFHTMPGRFFPAFDGAVGTGDCFHVPEPWSCDGQPHCVWNSGHFCAPQVKERLGGRQVGVVTWWRPLVRVREPNELWELYDVVQ